jgi:putative hemolysin
VFKIKKIIFLMLFLFFVSACNNNSNKVNETLRCSVDSDCVAEQCCHATSCVNSDYKADCSGRMCTMDCRPGTMDCGQGSCACENKQCAVKLKENAQIANPASVKCLEDEGKLDIRTDENGGQYGVCIFSDGRECEEWKHFRGEC